jgi:hypothetical protein
MKNEKNYELEFIISYNKRMYESENPNEYGMKLIQNGKYKEQNIFSLKLPKNELSNFLENPFNIVEFFKDTDKFFLDIWKVSMCVYNNNGFELPEWYNKCDGKLFYLEELFEEINN